ncbi:MAG: histidine kinase [Cyclobacteriaceae bacterium]|nr:histidine kinase [Cyclobacteriaceae bacterium]
MSKDIKILYVDDEIGNLNYFKSAFRREFNVLIAESGDEALKILKEDQNIPVILTDQRMPKMSGVTFLMQSINLVPDAIRILVTGYSDMETVINAINHGHIYYFINKPWSYDEMSIVIQRALDTYNLRVRNKELQLLNEQQEKEKVSAQLMMLQNQINPHFLFNCLNNLTALVDGNDPARKFIGKLSSIYRYLLEHKDHHLASLEEEFDFMDNYLYLQKVRFGDSMSFQNKIDLPYPDLLIPSGAIQLLVENAIKHNVATVNKPLIVEITIDGEWLVVRNNYQLKPGVESTGIGQQNLIKRYSLFTIHSPDFYEESGYYYAKIPLLDIKIK